MLYEIECCKFISQGSQRGVIRFNEGLNTCRGGKQSDNSIGKSTFLLIIDFCFGGTTYRDKIDIKAELGEHEIHFAHKFGTDIYYFSRSINDAGKVYCCNSLYEKSEKIFTDKEFCEFLRNKYGMKIAEGAFRKTTGRFIHIYGKGSYDEKRPLNQGAEKANEAIDAVEMLFSCYDKVAVLKEDYNDKEKKKQAFCNASKAGVLPLNIPKKKEVQKNEKRIEELENEIKQMQNCVGKELRDFQQGEADEVIETKSRLASLRRKRSLLRSRKKVIALNVTSELLIDQADIMELQSFFPNADIKRIEEIKQFHQSMRDILQMEMQEEEAEINADLEKTEAIIRQIEADMAEKGDIVTFSKDFLIRYAALDNEKKLLEKENEAYSNNEKYKKEAKQAKENLRITEEELLKRISQDINEQMVRYNDYIYNGNRNAPVIKLSDGEHYDFSTPKDDGTGTNFKSVIVFDLSVLALTELPILIHDSLMFNHIGHEPLEKLMELYNTLQKQVFIAFDRQDAPTDKIQKILDNSTVIRLGKNGNELFGRSWAKKEETE